MARAITCRYHCVTCGSHFTSLAAFDAHRQGAPEARVCVEPADVRADDGSAVLEAVDVSGLCDLAFPGGSPQRLAAQRIWAKSGSAERARAAFGAVA